MLSSDAAQASLTFVIFLIGIFLLGFLADPVLNLWMDPIGTISDTASTIMRDLDDVEEQGRISWADHFLKGFFSLGLVGLLKSGLLFSPWYCILFVIIGAFTALVGIWKTVKKLTKSLLKNMSVIVLDIGVEDEDDFIYEEEPEGNAQ
ncbi:hypothetical protein PT974_10810 [Cladobotryum mycophilum]|uniref:Transmembrane protein n=1 Tax=Cladobotryum mycophilum TaxID=491253 RepID=A0ABR0SBU5_9HYPO